MAIPWVLFHSSSKAFFWPLGCLLTTIRRWIKGGSQSIALKIDIQKYTTRVNMELPIVCRICMDSSLLCGACYFYVICGENQLPFATQFNYVYQHVCYVRSCSVLHSYDWILVQLSSPISIFLSSVKSVVGLYIGVNERTNEKRYPFLIYEDKYTMECDFFYFTLPS